MHAVSLLKLRRKKKFRLLQKMPVILLFSAKISNKFYKILYFTLLKITMGYFTAVINKVV